VPVVLPFLDDSQRALIESELASSSISPRRPRSRRCRAGLSMRTCFATT